MTTNAEQFAQQVGADIKALNQKITALEEQTSITTYPLTWGANVTAGSTDSVGRRNLSVKNGIGIIHLDFVANTNSGKTTIATLPFNAPTFEVSCDVNIGSGGHIWIAKGERTVIAEGFKTKVRILVDIIGFVK